MKTGLTRLVLALVLVAPACSTPGGGGVVGDASDPSPETADADVPDASEGTADAGDPGAESGTETADARDAAEADIKASLPRLVDPVAFTPAMVGEGSQAFQPAVALGPDGELALAWTEADGESGAMRIAFALYDAGGAVLAAPGLISTDPRGLKNAPALCALEGPGGGFVAAWSMDAQEVGPDGENLHVRFRRLGPDGAPLDAEDVPVLTTAKGNHWLADVACGSDGGFAVAGVAPDSDDLAFNVFVRRYGSDGAPLAEAVFLDPDPGIGQVNPAVSVGGPEETVLAWETSGPEDPNGASIVVAGAAPPSSLALDDVLLVAGDGPLEATGPEISFDRASKTFLVAAVLDGGSLVLTRYGSDGAILPGPSAGALGGTPLYNPAIAAFDAGGGHAIAYLQGSGSAITVRVALLGDTELLGGPHVAATGKLPAYRPAVAIRAGRLALAWTERDAGGAFGLRVARFE